MEDIIPCQVKDREVFQRVWQRVMEGRSEESSPIRPGSPNGDGDLSCECLEALIHRKEEGFPPACEPRPEQPQPPEEPECPPQEEPPMEPAPPVQGPVEEPECCRSEPEAPAPEPPSPESASGEGLPAEDGPDRDSDLPRLWEKPQPSDDRTARLRRQVMDALEGWQFYRYLARRARGTDARTLNSMAGEQHKEARKLSAAYFLLTGLRYWPSELLGTPAIPSYWGALRTRHQAEQRQENAYRLAADDWEDPDLLALYNELIEGCLHRSHQLRSLLEQGNT